MGAATLLLLVALIALIPAKIAQRKGHSALGYWVFGLLIWPVALIVALFVKDQRRRCPHCDEAVRPAANVCPHCHRDVSAAVAT